MNKWLLLAVAMLLFLASNFADYELQAYQHGWEPTGIVDMHHRADKLPDPWDWIPRDGWHVMQTIRNTCDKVGAALAFVGIIMFILYYYKDWCLDALLYEWRLYVFGLIGMYALAAITRGIAFSLPYRLLN
jgi:hypothetical protein